MHRLEKYLHWRIVTNVILTASNFEVQNIEVDFGARTKLFCSEIRASCSVKWPHLSPLGTKEGDKMEKKVTEDENEEKTDKQSVLRRR